MNYANKLVLGTVQFGLDYGVNNQSGQVQQSEVNKILQLAKESGIKKIDTSSAYGTSESVLGKSLSENNLQFHIISKYPQSENSVAAIFASSLEKLQQKKLYGYLVHHFEFYQSHPQLWEKMKDLKAEGKIDKIGFHSIILINCNICWIMRLYLTFCSFLIISLIVSLIPIFSISNNAE